MESLAPGSVDTAILLAPPGTVERRHGLALSLRALKPGGTMIAMAPNDKGGTRLAAELGAFGCEVEAHGKRKHRVCAVTVGPGLEGLDAAITAGAAQFVPELSLWSQPGVFSWNRLDPGTAQLIAALPPLSGRGADLGCGVGVLARGVLASAAVTSLDLVDVDRRAIAAARRNIEDPRVQFHWADVRREPELADLDFIVMNPPFHDGGAEDKSLGQAFIGRAHAMLRKGGVLWLVANRHLPYEAALNAQFARVTLKAQVGGYKVYEARR